MNAATWVALVAAAVALTVPWMAFRLALRQDAERWLREQRAELCADMLAEAHAEQSWLEHAQADEATQARMAPYFVDTRLSPAERARLGARGTALGSQTVNGLFNEMMAEVHKALLNLDRLDPDTLRMRTRVVVGAKMDAPRAAVRRELGADRIQLEAGAPAGGAAGAGGQAVGDRGT
jgi:hypothetical protein